MPALVHEVSGAASQELEGGSASTIRQKLTAAGLATASDVLLATPADLAKKLRSTSGAPVQIPDLVQAVAQAIAPRVHTALSLFTPAVGVVEGAIPTFISTGDAALDSMLGGGVRVGAITEITGER